MNSHEKVMNFHVLNIVATLLGVTLDNKLNFNAHINTVFKEACRKLNALICIAKYLNRNQKKMLINAFFYSHFNYCPLIWMFSSKASNDKIEKLHKRALQIIESDFAATYENLIAIDESNYHSQMKLTISDDRNL